MKSKREIYLSYLAERLRFEKDSFFFEYKRFLETKTDIIVSFKNELEFKKNHLNYLKRDGWANPTVSASEIENFTYCPVAFAITRTFDIPDTQLGQIGTKFHKEQIIVSKRQELKKISSFFLKKDFPKNENSESNIINQSIDDFISEGHEELFDELKNAELVYPDDKIDENHQKVFIGLNNWFAGKPDYIFKNKKSGYHFIIEEKFQNLKSTNSLFFENHLNQLRAYIFGIQDSDYAINHGYLIYWKYEIIEGSYKIKKCVCYKIEKNDTQRDLLARTYSKIKLFLTNKEADFVDIYRNPKKCSSCIATQFCSHKTGKLKKYKLPYSAEYFRPKYVPFPDALNKKSETEVIIWNEKKYWLYDRLMEMNLSTFLSLFGIKNVDAKDIVEYYAQWTIENEEIRLSDFTLKYLKENNILQVSKSELKNISWYNYNEFLNGDLTIHSEKLEVLERSILSIKDGKILRHYVMPNKVDDKGKENTRTNNLPNLNEENDESWSSVLS